MPAPDLSERASRAAAEVAEEAGLRFGRPIVLHNRSNLIVHLSPAPVVARVATTTGLVRRGDAWLAREVAVAGHLARSGAPVVAPTSELPPGPYLRDGLALSFWEYAEELAAPPDARRAGAGLRVCHEALTTLPGGLLPPMAVLAEARAIVERLARDGTLSAADAAALRYAGAEVSDRLDELAPQLQPVHGDAHLGNVIHTSAGPLWNDWEDTFAGPREWDLACLEASAQVFGSDTVGRGRGPLRARRGARPGPARPAGGGTALPGNRVDGALRPRPARAARPGRRPAGALPPRLLAGP